MLHSIFFPHTATVLSCRIFFREIVLNDVQKKLENHTIVVFYTTIYH